MEIRLTCTVSIPGFYQPSEVAAQYKFLGQTPYGAKRSRELHAVHHRGSRRILAELMNMAEPLERTPYLLIYEVGGFLHLGDPVRHLKRDAEMPSTPGHFFVSGNETGRHAIYRLFARLPHGVLVGVDVPGKVK